MAEALLGSLVMTPNAASPKQMAAPGLGGGNLHCWIETVEVTAAAAATSTYDLAVLPSNARLTPDSKIYWDDLASTGSPTLDLGLFNPTGYAGTGITPDDDGFFADADVTSAGSKAFIADIANAGKALWQFVSGQAADPKQPLLVRATLKDAAANVGGTLTVCLYYTLD